ncbi:hypothetical protein LP419_10875 [Massilia sp. H-1]|nr:hypothetical protein LP419_10875 [Massilia sp. H-1]
MFEDFQFASIIVSTIRNAPVLIFAAMAKPVRRTLGRDRPRPRGQDPGQRLRVGRRRLHDQEPVVRRGP